MPKTVMIILKSLLIVSTFLSTTWSNAGQATHIFGFCTVTGNIDYFEVECTKEIRETISKEGLASAKGMYLMGIGERTSPYSFKQSLSGYAENSVLTFTVIHTDGTSSHITIN